MEDSEKPVLPDYIVWVYSSILKKKGGKRGVAPYVE
jgi:hypothetical protein